MKLTPILLGILTTTAAAAVTLVPSIASAEMLSVKAQSANFRASPNDKATIVYSADKFYPVEVLERKSGWAKVKDFEGDTAWVAERVLGKQQTIVIHADSANIREKPTTESEVVFKVAHGEVFKVQERKDDWVKVVDTHGDGGWIRMDKTWGIEEPGADKKGDKKGDDKKPDDKPGQSKAKTADNGDKPAPKADDKKPVCTDKMECVCHDLECTCRVVHHEDKATADVSDPPKTEPKKPESKPQKAHDKKPAAKPQKKK
ncbi:MAG: SH3 domain-containing protein [Polyangiaceae bacterium]